MYYCNSGSPSVQLYRIATRRWRSLAQPSDAGVPEAVGGDWVQYLAPVTANRAVFQNIDTGQERILSGWMPGGSIIPDLNSPGLARRLCRPLRVPGVWNPRDGTPQGPGQISFYGRFAAVSGTSRPTNTTDVWPVNYVGRCGTRLHVDLWGSPAVGNGNAIMAADDNGTNGYPNGLFLPSLHPFNIDLERFVTDQFGSSPDGVRTFMTARRIYLMAQDPSDQPECYSHDLTCGAWPPDFNLWSAPAPKEPHKRTGKHPH
jgi:hypothetical protein